MIGFPIGMTIGMFVMLLLRVLIPDTKYENDCFGYFILGGILFTWLEYLLISIFGGN